jgi:enamine deaminase RidA (YjgF/YER057c/UK114 family)
LSGFVTRFRDLYFCGKRTIGPRTLDLQGGNATVTVHRFHNPPTIFAPRGYTHVVEVTAPGRTIYISGQVGMSVDGKIAGDFRAQAVQSLENLKSALAAAGAGLEHVVKITNYFVDMAHLAEFREVRDRYFDTKAPPASTAVQVVRLAQPDFLFEIEAIAVVPLK